MFSKTVKKKTHTEDWQHITFQAQRFLIWISEDCGSIHNVSVNILDFPRHYWQNVGRLNCVHKGFSSSSARDCLWLSEKLWGFPQVPQHCFAFFWAMELSRLKTSSWLPRTCETCSIGHSGSNSSTYCYQVRLLLLRFSGSLNFALGKKSHIVFFHSYL